MRHELTANEARVIGCLIEKSVTTPDQYPLTLNALKNACNQKSSRDPVMNLEQGAVQHTVRELEKKKLVTLEENFRRGVEKYSHRFYTTQYEGYQFDSAQRAVICLLLLRGPQTPGELRTRAARLHAFNDNGDVVTALNSLMANENEPLVVKLPRTPGRKDAEYTHLFCGEIDVESYEAQVETAKPKPRNTQIDELIKRVTSLETDVLELKRRLNENNS
ncbi:MAG: YceH family protein [Gammaproteobacteria bacterium]